MKEFQADSNVRVAILGILAAGVGITLTSASTVVFAELHWTPGMLVQAEDRAHRIGQKSSVNVHYLVARGTLDDIMWPLVAHKVEIVSAMCDGKKDHLVANVSSAERAMQGLELSADWQDGPDDDMCGLAEAIDAAPELSLPQVTEKAFTAVRRQRGRLTRTACCPCSRRKARVPRVSWMWMRFSVPQTRRPRGLRWSRAVLPSVSRTRRAAFTSWTPPSNPWDSISSWRIGRPSRMAVLFLLGW